MQVEALLDPTIEAPARARAVVNRLSDALPAVAHRDLRLVVTELVANAVKYGPPEAIRLWVSVSADTLRGEVVDAGTGQARIDRERPLDAGGLGLQIVDALCSAWCNPKGTGLVWFELSLVGDDPTRLAEAS
jgi:anti-sigma regulatory factor (Ser/Thr protein kinase)